MSEEQDKSEAPKYSLKTGEGCFTLHYNFSTAPNYTMPRLIGAYLRVFGTHQQKEEVHLITDVRHLDEERVQIKRRVLYKQYYNSLEEAPEEVITVRRDMLGKEGNAVMRVDSVFPGVKSEVIRLMSSGQMIKRMLLDEKACVAFRNPIRRQMLGDVYMYKQLLVDKQMQDILEQATPGQKLVKDDLNKLRMIDLFELV